MSDTDLLSPQQETAMLALLEGHTQRRAAVIAGVTEGTISRWLNDDDSAFLKLYASRRADVWKAYESRIAELVDAALGGLLDLTRSPAYTGRDDYDSRVRLDACRTILIMAKLLPTGTRIATFGGQVAIGQQQAIAVDQRNTP